MGKGQRNRRQSAREKIAAQQAAARRAERRRRTFLFGGSVLAVIVIVVVLIVVKTTAGTKGGGTEARAADATVAQAITTLPLTTFNSVGKGTASALIATKGQPALTENGKPEMLYMGAEYCPYCAAERWAMAAALSRFGSFTGLQFIHSSSTDTDANTPTLSFYKSTYKSQYLAFTPVEWYGRVENSAHSYPILQNPTTQQQQTFAKYDAPPYVSTDEKGSFPFVDIGNQYLIIGSQYQPTGLAGMTWAQVAAAMKDPSSTAGQAIDGAANAITAAICKVTKGQPGSVCTSPGVTKAESNL